jgi:glutamate-1-semialdehyde 2,1-aminomutase
MTPTMTAGRGLAERFAAEFPNSRRLAERARGVFPDGVTHDNRHLEPFPIYIDRAAGAYKWDVDGHRLLDYWGGHGALLLGHSHPAVVDAVQEAAGRVTHPGACHEKELEWGQWVQRLILSAERVRFTSSGTEATLMALRLARIFTGKPRVLKFRGHFHGWHDAVMPAAYPPHDDPVPGIPDEVRGSTVVVTPGDANLVEDTLRRDASIGCVILEPTGGHWGAIPVRKPFLEALRDITTRLDRLLIFDEVITGFRVSPGGAQGYYGVTPDLTTLAKILAGGLPGGCVAGRADILSAIEHRSGARKMKHPGTFNGNPLSAAAGVAALQLVATGEPCRKANESARRLRQKLNVLFAAHGLDWIAYGEFSGWRLIEGYQGPRPTGDDFIPYDGDVAKLDAPRNAKLHHGFRQAMLLHGVDVWGTSGMTSVAHTEEEVDLTVSAIEGSIDLLKRQGIV